MLWRYPTLDITEVRRTVDNFWVILYCLTLSNMFQCHLNAELGISKIGGIKHLFKYICKVSDRVAVQMIGGQRRYDEISTFKEARYFSTSEAVWKLFQFAISK